MGVVNSMDDVLKALTGGFAQHPSFSFDNRMGAGSGPSPTNGQLISLWKFNKSNGANGKVPDAPIVCNKSTLGAMPYNDAAATKQLYLTGWEGSAFLSGTVMMYDRLLQAGLFDSTVFTDQAINLVPTRNVSGIGNEIWIEIHVLVGTSTTSTLVVNYTNQNGEAKTTPATQIGGTGNREDGRIIRVPLADGDTGVKGLTSVRMLSTTGTAGGFAVLLVRPICSGAVENPGAAFYRDFITGTPSLPPIENNSCLAFAAHYTSGNAVRGNVAMHMIEV